MNTVSLLIFASFAVAVVNAGPFKYGNAAYTYGPLHCTPNNCDVVPSCNRAKWAEPIAEYNKDAQEGSEINIIYSYGGDIEFWPNNRRFDEQGKLIQPNVVAIPPNIQSEFNGYATRIIEC